MRLPVQLLTFLVIGCLVIFNVVRQRDTIESAVARQFKPPSSELTWAFRYRSMNNPHPHLVIAALKTDDTSWIARRLPDWTSSVYQANSHWAELSVPKHKGGEAMVYLSFLIDNYEDLPPITVFMHGRQYQWHNDDQNYDSATVLSRIQTRYIEKEGYVTMRCAWKFGCPDEIHMLNPRPEQTTAVEYMFAYNELFPGEAEQDNFPEIVAVACCAQFAVTRPTVLRKPKSEYIRLRQWLLHTPLPDSVSGRVFEYSWHMIFGKGAVFCPHAGQCYCELFGECDLSCEEDRCGERWKWPGDRFEPPGWRELPTYWSNSTMDEGHV